MELWRMSAAELARTIRVGQASSREAVNRCSAAWTRSTQS